MRVFYQDGNIKDVDENKTYKKPSWYKKAESLLRSYKNLPMEIENLQLQLEFDRLAGPSITAKYTSAMAQSSGTSSPVENTITREEALQEKLRKKKIRLKMLTNIINAFNQEEKQVYYLRYELEKQEKEIYFKLQMSRTSYFELQKMVALKAARWLSIPIPDEDLPEEWKGELFEDIPPICLNCTGPIPDYNRT